MSANKPIGGMGTSGGRRLGPLSPRHDYLTGASSNNSNAVTLMSLNDMSHLNNNSQSNIIMSQADVTATTDIVINIPVKKTLKNINDSL